MRKLKRNSATLNLAISALGDPARRPILGQLVQGEVTVNELANLAEPTDLALSAVSKRRKTPPPAESLRSAHHNGARVIWNRRD